MKQRDNIGDKNKIGVCIYCGSMDKILTREHSPSKVLLNEPFPENLPITYSCRDCNSSFSSDEEYFACILECIKCGTVEISKLKRRKIQDILTKNKKLYNLIINSYNENSKTFLVDYNKLYNVVLKLAKGHLSFEMNENSVGFSDYFQFRLLTDMNKDDLVNFEQQIPVVNNFCEISRITKELLIYESPYSDPFIVYPWHIVQDGQYRYMCAYINNQWIVKIVISECCFFEIHWQSV